MSGGTRARTGTGGIQAPPTPSKPKADKMAKQGLTDQASSKLDAVLAAVEKLEETINQTRTSLESKIDKVAIDLTHLRADHRKLADRTATLETTIADIKPQVVQTDKRVQKLLNRVEFLEERTEDAKGRARRNNVHVVGLPEGKEGRDPTSYVENRLCDLLPEGVLSPHFVVEQAHRVPARPPPTGSNLRPFLIRLLNYRDRDTILQETRKLQDIQIHNQKIMFFPDYTIQVQRQRYSFMAVKRRLRQCNLKYSLLFPARLRVVANGKHISSPPQRKQRTGWTPLIP